MAAVTAVTLGLAGAACASPVEVYDFTGVCSDCTGDGVGVLTVDGGYQLGDNITSSNFVSFTYSSNLVSSFTLTGSDINNFSGAISTIPGANVVELQTVDSAHYFYAGSGGYWCVSSNSCADYGFTSTWTAAGGVPEPAGWALMIVGTWAVGGALRSSRRRLAAAA